MAETHAQDGDTENTISGVERMEQSRDIFCKRNSRRLGDVGLQREEVRRRRGREGERGEREERERRQGLPLGFCLRC